MNVVYLVSVSDRINLFKVCTYLHLNCDDWFTQWQKEAGQQHGKSLPISSWDAAEEVVASAIYGSGYYISLKFSIMSNVSLPSNISAVCNTWNSRSSVGSKGCSALSRSKESFTRPLLSKMIPRNPSPKPREDFDRIRKYLWKLIQILWFNWNIVKLLAKACQRYGH